jgi:hypothetical protein
MGLSTGEILSSCISFVQIDWDGYTIGYYGRIFEARNKAKGGSFEASTPSLDILSPYQRGHSLLFPG